MKLSKSKKLSFGIIGCGRILNKHLQNFERKELNFSLIAACDLKIKKAEKLKNKFKNIYTTSDYKKLLDDKNISNICILTDSGSHYKLAKEALLKGKNIIVEKPLTLKLDHTKELILLAKKVKKKVFVVMQNRFNLSIQKTLDFLKKKKLGKIVMVTIRVRWFRDNKYYKLDKWRGTWRSDGGALTNQGIHHIDLMQVIGGKVDYVSSYTSTRLSKIETEDTAVGILKFKNGALGTLEVTTAARPKDLEGSISILGEKGTIEIGGFAANKIEKWIFRNKNDNIKVDNLFESPKNVYGFGHKKFYDEVVKSLLGEKNKTIKAKDSLHSLEILHALYESSLTLKTVSLSKKNFKNKLNNAKV